MKIWVKLLAGSLLGIVLGILAPLGNEVFQNWIAWFAELAIRIGRYAAVPLLVFSLAIAVNELSQEGRFWGLAARTFLLILGSAALVVTMGILATLAFPPSRIPITEGQMEMVSLTPREDILALFPANMFAAMAGDGLYLAPACVFAFFLGMGFSYDKSYTKPALALLDSLSRIFYHIASFFSEIMGIVMIALAAYWAFRFHQALKADVFRDLILLLGVTASVLAFVILPLLLCFIKPRGRPWAAIYGSLGQALGGFFSGDINFSLPLLIRHVKENLGVRRRCIAVTVTLFAIFGRAGSAMVAASAFIVIINSYSSLGITLMDMVSIGLRAFGISFLLARHPGDGAYTALGLLCLGYGRGFEAGYLILKPLAFFLIAIGAFLDLMIASFAAYAIGRTEGFQEDKSLRHFI